MCVDMSRLYGPGWGGLIVLVNEWERRLLAGMVSSQRVSLDGHTTNRWLVGW